MMSAILEGILDMTGYNGPNSSQKGSNFENVSNAKSTKFETFDSQIMFVTIRYEYNNEINDGFFFLHKQSLEEVLVREREFYPLKIKDDSERELKDRASGETPFWVVFGGGQISPNKEATATGMAE